jgi:hypothetical protein
MTLRLKILLTYATGIALLWVGVLWLRKLYPAQHWNAPQPAAKVGQTCSVSPWPA